MSLSQFVTTPSPSSASTQVYTALDCKVRELIALCVLFDERVDIDGGRDTNAVMMAPL